MKIHLTYELMGTSEIRQQKQVFDVNECRKDPVGFLTSMVELQTKRWIVIRDQFYVCQLIKEVLTENPVTLSTVLTTDDLSWVRQIPSHKPGIYVELTLILK